MAKSRIIFIVWLLVWAVMLFAGIQLYTGIVAQKVPGYPKIGQLNLYVLFPGLLVVVNIFLTRYACKLPFGVVLLAFLIQLLALPMLILVAGGGI
ncbi:hypothetical protein [Burkholderia pseudomallei]